MRSLPLAALSALALSMPAHAQEAAPLSIKSTEVTRLDTIPHYAGGDSLICCAMEVLESGPDHDFVYMHVLLDVAWTEEIKRISYYGGTDVKLKLPGQTDPESYLVPWGTMDWFPEVRTNAPSINEGRDRAWPEVDNDTYLDAVFTVPSDVTEGVLIIGKKDEPAVELSVNLSGEVTELPPAGSLWQAEITGLGIADELATERNLRNQIVPGRITAGMGRMMRIDMVLRPRRDLKVDRLTGNSAAAFTSKQVALIGPEGLPLAMVGEARNNGPYLVVGNDDSSVTNWREGSQGEIKRTFYFIGSGAPGEYRLYFKGMNIAGAMLVTE